jgi:hypothetical protein
MTIPTDPLTDLRNLGEKGTEVLRKVGIEAPSQAG